MDREERDILLNEAIKELVKTPDGKRLLQWLFNQCRVEEQLAGSEIPTMMFYEGRRSIGIAAQKLILKATGTRHVICDIMEFDNDR